MRPMTDPAGGSAAGASAPPAGLGQQVQDLVNATLVAAHATGLTEIEERLRAEAARWQEPQTTVVVAGEAKRGKSSLVNALLGRPGLSPVDADVTTNTHVVIRYGEEAAAFVHPAHGGDARPISFDEVADWCTVAGNPDNTKSIRAVELRIPHPLLAGGLTLIDTPGVGGLEASHADVTLAALAHADALVFLVDAGAPMSAPELAFLERAGERLDTVLFALTHTDMYHGWRRILEDDSTLLARHARRFADSPFLPVSNRLKTKSDRLAAAGEADLAAELRAESGFAAFERALQERVLDRTQLLRLGNLVQLAAVALTRLEGPYRAIVDSAEERSESRARLEAHVAELQEFQRAGKIGGTDWNYEWQRLDTSLNRELTRLIDILAQRASARIAIGDAHLLDTLPAELDAELQAMVAALNYTLEAEVTAMLERIGRTFSVGTLAAAVAPVENTGVGAAANALRAGGGEGNPWLRMRSAIIGGSSFASVAALVGGPLIWAGAAVGILVGGIGDYAASRQRLGQQGQQKAREFVRDAVNRARSGISQDLRHRLLTLKQDIERQIAVVREERERELKTAVEEQQRFAKADQKTRDEAQAAARKKLAHVRELEKLAGGLLRALHTASVAPPAAPAAG